MTSVLMQLINEWTRPIVVVEVIFTITCLLCEHIVRLPHSPGGQVARTYTLATLDLRTLDLARSAVVSAISTVVLARAFCC